MGDVHVGLLVLVVAAVIFFALALALTGRGCYIVYEPACSVL